MVPMNKLLTCHVAVAWRRTQEHIVELLRRLRDTQHGNFLRVLLIFMTVHLFQFRLGSIVTPFGQRSLGSWYGGPVLIPTFPYSSALHPLVLGLRP